jgi:hypothetical protein
MSIAVYKHGTIASMVAAMQFNDSKTQPMDAIYGIVTTGSLWRFLKLERDNRAFVDKVEYHIHAIDRLFGIFHQIIT